MFEYWNRFKRNEQSGYHELFGYTIFRKSVISIKQYLVLGFSLKHKKKKIEANKTQLYFGIFCLLVKCLKRTQSTQNYKVHQVTN